MERGDSCVPRYLKRLYANYQNMKFRHTAALALVGWYLMTPPVTKTCPPQGFPCTTNVDVNAPLNRWHVDMHFDSAEECDERATSLHSHWSGENSNAGSLEAFLAAVDGHAQCVASDDPRLAKWARTF